MGAGLKDQDSVSDDSALLLKTKRAQLLRSGEAINLRGEPLGYGCSGIATFEAPNAARAMRALVVIGHHGGLSVIECAVDQQAGWRHEISSTRNKRWTAKSPVPIEGQAFVTNFPASKPPVLNSLHRVERMDEGISDIACVIGTPWQTALCAESAGQSGRREASCPDGQSGRQEISCPSGQLALQEASGWVVEVQPQTGVVIKRLSVGRIEATRMMLSTVPGQSVRLYAIGRGGTVFRYTSHKQYISSYGSTQKGLMSLGELSVADLATATWHPLASKELGAEAFEEAMQNPYGTEAVKNASTTLNVELPSHGPEWGMVAGFLGSVSHPQSATLAGVSFELAACEDGGHALSVSRSS